MSTYVEQLFYPQPFSSYPYEFERWSGYADRVPEVLGDAEDLCNNRYPSIA
mgnify:FL=1